MLNYKIHERIFSWTSTKIRKFTYPKMNMYGDIVTISVDTYFVKKYLNYRFETPSNGIHWCLFLNLLYGDKIIEF